MTEIQVHRQGEENWEWCCNVAPSKAQVFAARKNRMFPGKTYRVKPGEQS